MPAACVLDWLVPSENLVSYWWYLGIFASRAIQWRMLGVKFPEEVLLFVVTFLDGPKGRRRAHPRLAAVRKDDVSDDSKAPLQPSVTVGQACRVSARLVSVEHDLTFLSQVVLFGCEEGGRACQR